MTDPAAVEPCRYCLAAWGETAEVTCEGHKAEAEWIALGLARMVHGAKPTDEQVGWFIEDGESVLASLGADFEVTEETQLEVAKLAPTPAGFDRFEVNGRQFVIDPNAEGPAGPDPIGDYDFIDLGWMA